MLVDMGPGNSQANRTEEDCSDRCPSQKKAQEIPREELENTVWGWMNVKEKIQSIREEYYLKCALSQNLESNCKTMHANNKMMLSKGSTDPLVCIDIRGHHI